MRGNGAGSMSHSAISASASTGVCAMSSSSVGVHWYDPPPMKVIFVDTGPPDRDYLAASFADARVRLRELREPRLEGVEQLPRHRRGRLVGQPAGERVGEH